MDLRSILNYFAFICFMKLNTLCIPNFIDRNHPWFDHNHGPLRELFNFTSYLCDVSRSIPYSLERDPLPDDLFNHIQIGWDDGWDSVEEIIQCEAAMQGAKSFKIELPEVPPPPILDQVGDMLGNMTGLETLQWALESGSDQYFEERFLDRGLVLPSVKTLDLTRSGLFLLGMCPNVSELEGRDIKGLLEEPIPFAPAVTRSAFEASWSGSMVRNLVSSLPSIQGLGLLGRMATAKSYGDDLDFVDETEEGNDNWDYTGSGLEEALQPARSLANLTHLELPWAMNLDVGFSGGPGCGNVYFGPDGLKYERLMMRDGLKAIRRAASLTLEILPSLKGLRIGDTDVTIMRHDNGTLGLSFPWTSRIDEYILEEVPDRDW
ncbi:hypothetical protein GGS20DRAFT_595671 [Poronia punctata]|nr:hypothetical protein GGS20DRAFT_595671 [Poronia punctata]